MAALLFLLAVFVIFRLPPLLNARGLSSDAAIVGLQAMHILKGEWSRFIWGANYQGVPEAALIALAFSVLGISAFGVMLVPVLGHALIVILTYRILEPLLPRRAAVLLTLIVVLTPIGINMFGLSPPRQWAITVFFLGFAWIHRAGRWWPLSPRRSLFAYFGGAALAVSSLYLDLFTLQFLPAFGVFALACGLDDIPGRIPNSPGMSLVRLRIERWVSVALGFAAGYVLVQYLRQGPVTASSATELGSVFFDHNWKILTESALPWMLGYGVYIPGPHLYPDLWTPPFPVRAFQVIGGLSLLPAILAGGLLCLRKEVPWSLRRLGAFGFLSAAATFGGFLVSAKVQDMWAVRYLAPLIWTAPFALAPLAFLLRRSKWVYLAVPYLVVAAVGGWMSYGPYVDGPVPVRSERGIAADEQKLAEFLRARDIHFGAAQYWLSYRLTFLFGENPAVTPLNEGEDRYGAYSDGFAKARKRAFIFHPSEPRAKAEDYARALESQTPGKIERAEGGGIYRASAGNVS